MATEGLLQIRDSQPASGDLSAHQYKIMDFNASSQLVLAGAAAGRYVLLDKPNAAGVEGAILLAGKGKVILGGTVAAGDPLTSDASGLAVVAAPAAGVNNDIIGFALEAGVSGDLIKFDARAGVIQG